MFLGKKENRRKSKKKKKARDLIKVEFRHEGQKTDDPLSTRRPTISNKQKKGFDDLFEHPSTDEDVEKKIEAAVKRTLL